MTVATGKLEQAILRALTGKRVDLTPAKRDRMETSGGWLWGRAEDYDAALALDAAQVCAFVTATQLTQEWERQILDLSPGSETRAQFLQSLAWEVGRRGVVDVMRRGMTFGPFQLKLFYGASASTGGSLKDFRHNRFSVIPRLKFSQDGAREPVDLCLFVNGLPVLTLALADSEGDTSVDEAIAWYRRLPIGEEPLFQPGRCMAHLAVDAERVAVCANLREHEAEFVPFNRGPTLDAPNPPSLFGVATDYLWRRILTRRSVTDLLEHYAQIVTGNDTPPRTIFPRYHQLDLVRALLDDIDYYGVGRRYLLDHAPGSGRSQSLVWLVSQLLDLEQVEMAMFGTVVVVTDRPITDHSLLDAIRQCARVSLLVDARGLHRSHIEELLESPNRIVIVDVAYLAFVLEEIRVHFHGSGYAIVLDETAGHGGASSMEARVNQAMEGHESLPNASYFVFSATPNATTLERFGIPSNDHGVTRYRPFHAFGLH